MRLLSDIQAGEWCRERGLATDGTLPSTRISFPGHPANPIRIHIPDDAIAAVKLAYMLLITGTPEFEERQFSGALIWLQRWQIWSAEIDQVGYVLLNSLRGETRDSADFASTPGHLFAQPEFVLGHACLVVPMLFGWDTHFVPAHGTFFAFVSHEGWVDLVPRDLQTHEALLRRFREWTPGETID